MEKIQIGNTNLQASRICLGTWAIGGWLWGGADEAESVRAVQAAIAKGITVIDTAPVYGFGKSEEIVGKAVAASGKRKEILLATKAGLQWDNNKIARNTTAKRIQQEFTDSLKRLQTDYIDIYQIHWPDPLTPIAETAQTMKKLYDQGKIRAVGVSNFSVEQIKEFTQYCPLHVSQPPYNLFERQIETALLPYSEKNNITTFAYGALCRGLLGGKINANTEFKGDDIRKVDPKFQAPRLQEYLNAVSALNKFAQENYGKNVLALAIRWVLDKGNTIALWGARRPEQLDGIEEIFGWSLDKSAMDKIDQIIKENILDPVGPEFMAPPTR